MHSLLWLGFRAFIISLVLTPICRDVFRSYGVVDQPDAAQGASLSHSAGGRPGHCHFVSGRLSIGASGRRQPAGAAALAGLEIASRAAALAFGIGLLDDLFNLRAWIKLIGQLAAAGLACCGRRAHSVDRRRFHRRLVEHAAYHPLAAGLHECLQPGGRAGRFGRGSGTQASATTGTSTWGDPPGSKSKKRSILKGV